jgi:cell division transport system permease protein
MGQRPALVSWADHHRKAASQSLQRLIAEPVQSFLTCLAVGVALALPAVLWAFLQNVEVVAGNIQTSARFTLLLEQDVSLETAQLMAAELETRSDIELVEAIDRRDALARFAEEVGFSELVDNLHNNPLPNSLQLHPGTSLTESELDDLADALVALSGVAQVVFDTQWQARLQAAITASQRLTLGVGVLMVLGAVLILGNTVRLGIEARREEITVIKLIGGGDGFARRPLLYAGLWSGSAGGFFGAVLVVLLFWFVSPPAERLFDLYGLDRRFIGLGLPGMLILTAVGGLAGLVSAWSTALIHLRRTQPR